jgi:HlyD family secretion protein
VPAAGSELEALAKLRPGMSAHAAIEVASMDDALVVPIQAVLTKKRKEVEEAFAEADSTTAPDEGNAGSVAAEPAEEGQPRAIPGQNEDVDVLFVDRDGVAEMILVTTGLSDEFNVEIVDAPLQEGDRVVIGPYRTLKKLKHGDKVVKVEQDDELREDT